MKKRIISSLLAAVLLFAIVPSANATSNLTLDIDWEQIKQVGHQISGGQACTCYAYAYCKTILDGRVHYYTEFNQGTNEYNAWAPWTDGATYTGDFPSSKDDAFKKLYSELSSKKPAAVKVAGRRSSHHYVAVVGYENVQSESNLSASNFLIIDPCAPEFKMENMASVGYDLKMEDGVYQVTYSTTGKTASTTDLTPMVTIPATIDEGYYALTPACAPSARLDISAGSAESGANAQIWNANDSDAQTFRFTSTDSGYYTIAAKCSGLVLDVFQGASSSGTNVAQYNYGGGTNQQWLLNDVGGGYYEIIPRMSNSICLDVSGADSAEGTNVQIWERNQTDAQKWKLTSVALQENPAKDSITVTLPKQTIYFQDQFSDVPANQWYTNNVAEAFELGLMKGNSSTTFNPYGDVTIAEAITMASRIHNIYTNGSENIRKANSGETWYKPYLDYAYDNGIIRAALYNSNVSQKANRAQFAEIFANALPDEALSAINSVSDNAIPDVKTSESYASYVYKLYRAGILGGSDANGTFHPTTYITRAEAATIVARMGVSTNRINISLG